MTTSNSKSQCLNQHFTGCVVKRFARRSLLLAAVCASLNSAGCATMKPASLWPFGKKAETADTTAPAGSFASTVTGAGKGMVGQFQSMGTAVKSAAGKAKTAVIAPFSNTEKSDDPTSLTNMPSSIGPEVFVANGQLSEAQGNFTKALDSYTKALEIEPNNLSALLSTARLYDRQGQSVQATEFFQKAIKAKPNDASIYNELGLVQNKAGRVAEGEANLQKAIALDPTNSRYRNNLAGLLVSNGRSDEAVKQLEQVFSPAKANYNVAYLHATNQNVAAAQQHLQIALQIDPNLKEAHELMNRLGGSNAVTAASNAYNMAGNVMQTVQGLSSPYGPTATPGVQQGPYSQPTPGFATPGFATPGQASLQTQPNGAGNTQVMR